MKKSNFWILIAVLVFAITTFQSCGGCSRNMAWVAGHNEVVVDNVVYLQFPSGVTVKYNEDGTICTKK